VQNLMKKHQLVEADIVAHEDRIKDMNDQADSLVESGQFDSSDILEKRDLISTRYKHIQAGLAFKKPTQKNPLIIGFLRFP
jgi:spectrin alpha